MTLDKLRPVADRAIEPNVRVFDRLGATPDHVSLVAFGCACLAGAWFVVGTPIAYVLGAAFVFANGWFDLVDGALAREQAVASTQGDLLDHVLDRYADIVIVVGLAAGIEAYGLGLLAITGVLMTSYLGTQAIAVGFDRVYGGLVGRADRLAIIGVVGVVMAIYPHSIGPLTIVGWVLVFLGIVGHLTAFQRFWLAFRGLS